MHVDAAVVRGDDRMDQVQPDAQPGPALTRLRLIEPFEQVGTIPRSNPRSIVDDVEHRVRARRPHAHIDASRAGSVTDGVGDQVQEYLL